MAFPAPSVVQRRLPVVSIVEPFHGGAGVGGDAAMAPA